MEDDLNFLENGRRPQFSEDGRQPQFSKHWKRTSMLKLMEDDLNFKVK